MNSKDTILRNLRKAEVASEPKPKFDHFKPTVYPDLLAQFKKALEGAATSFVELEPGQDINEIVKNAYPNAKSIASNLPEITCATFNPDDLDDAKKLDGTDVAVIKGEFGVCENGMVWVPASTKFKALYFISENLVIILDKKQLVNNMHEAYKRPGFDKFEYGCFIAGPSKTADIEQALVVGAHGARAVTVILT